jgi:hypothetical protein
LEDSAVVVLHQQVVQVQEMGSLAQAVAAEVDKQVAVLQVQVAQVLL